MESLKPYLIAFVAGVVIGVMAACPLAYSMGKDRGRELVRIEQRNNIKELTETFSSVRRPPDFPKLDRPR